MIMFPCPRCHEALEVASYAAGKKGRCPHCQKLVTVPMPYIETVPPQPISRQLIETVGTERAAQSSTATLEVEDVERASGLTGEWLRRAAIVAAFVLVILVSLGFAFGRF